MAVAVALLTSCAVGPRPPATPGDLLSGLTLPMDDFRAARVSSYDKTGGNKDALTDIAPGQTVVLADLEGPGMISHIWITISAEKYHGRTIVLRMFWDDEPDPSVLTPINDFFCMGHAKQAAMWSLPITTTANGRARNCFFHMPFNRHARIEITNEGLKPVGAFYYYIDYRKYEKPFRDPLYFHARYRQEYPAEKGSHYLICSARGRGHFVGMNYSIESHGEGWWGEGDDRIFIDGESTPSFHGTGSEDYLCDAWGIWPGSSPFYGCSIHEGYPHGYPDDTRYTSYRFHIADPIPFRKSLVFEMEHYGVGEKNGHRSGYTERQDNLSSVAYWYQTEPHAPMEPLPSVDMRLPDEAKEEKQLLGFLRRAGEPQNSESIGALRTEFDALRSDPENSARQIPLAVAMATAELNFGDNEKAHTLLEDYFNPFPLRSVVPLLDDLSAKTGAMMALTPTTPLLVPWEDGSIGRAEREGRPCIITDQSDRKPHVYFSFPEHSPLHNIDDTVVLRIHYYSEGRTSDTLAIDYDSFYSNDLSGFYRVTRAVEKPAEAGWYTADVECPRARFNGHQNGRSDFRITNMDDGDECIGRIEVIKPKI